MFEVSSIDPSERFSAIFQMRSSSFRTLVGMFLILSLTPSVSSAQANDRLASLKAALTQAGENRKELEKALWKVPEEQYEGMHFLVEHMPDPDLKTLKADFLLENVHYAYKVKDLVPWGHKIPNEIFLNYVLPYGNVDEARDPWRKEFLEKFLPLIKDCKTPAEGAQRLNEQAFPLVKVKYSRKRNRANQSPKESIEIGKASCTGLSILLIDACRAVGIPTRFVGIPNWANKRGNHSWVEIWDQRWHFTGACEPSKKGLNHAWFTGDASLAKKDDPRHSIYAVSYRKTGTAFPMVWAPRNRTISAINVTDNYAKKAPKTSKVRLMVKVVDSKSNERISIPIRVKEIAHSGVFHVGVSKGEGADTNDFLTFDVHPNQPIGITYGHEGNEFKSFKLGSEKQKIIEIAYSAKKKEATLPPELQDLKDQLNRYFKLPSEKRGEFRNSSKNSKLLTQHEDQIRQLIWEAYKSAPEHAERKKNFEGNKVVSGKHTSPYTVKNVGARPEGGWPLFIAMHGGGGAPARVNDSQWRIMQRYYKDHPEVGGYKYLALRAPNNTWNGFYDDYVYPLIIRLVQNFTLFGDVNPDKVFIMGYSHGGYGAFAIGPKIPDRFAAIHSSAAAPTDGQSSAKTLRNTVFTYMIGERDTAYGRIKRCRAFNEKIKALKGDRKDIYPVVMEYKAGFGHGGLPDRDKIKSMYPNVRNLSPKHLTWEMTDSVVTSFFWLSVPKAKRKQEIEAKIDGQTITVKAESIDELSLNLDSRLIDFSKDIKVKWNGDRHIQIKARPNLSTLIGSMVKRGDPKLAHTFSIKLSPQPEKTKSRL